MKNSVQIIKKFIDDKNIKKIIVKKKYNSIFVNKIKTYLDKNVVNDKKYDFEKDNESVIKKINEEDNYPLLYKILNDIDYFGKEMEYEKFLDWYREKYVEINIEKILYSNSKYFNIIFNQHYPINVLNKLFYDNSFVSLDIIHKGESNDIKHEKYSDTKTQIELFYLKDKKKPDVELIFKIVDFFRILSKKDINLKLVIFYNNQKRFLPHNKLMTAENINGGASMDNHYVYIWRKEDFYKVLIHELIHYFNLDFHKLDNDILGEILRKIIKIDGRDVNNEAYTEIMALTINSVLYSLMLNIDFSDIIYYENIFTHLQIAKIINLFGGDNYDDLFNITIKQNTSVVSYIIVKGMLLNNYDTILKHFDQYFDKDENEKFDDYFNIYSILVNKKSLNKDLINYFLDKLKNNEIKDEFIKKTMKMIVFEL